MTRTKQNDGKMDLLCPSLEMNPLTIFDIAKTAGRPLYTCAPMVRYSKVSFRFQLSQERLNGLKLAFRETVAHYGVDLAWTPMILAKEFNRSEYARDSDFTISPTSPPTIVQFGCNSPLELSRATTLLAPYVNGIDINCGCPQSWACAETLGAALMHKRELVASMVSSAKTALHDLGYADKKTVSVKIRVHKDLRETVDFIRTVEAAGADFITIHGRLRSTPSSHPVDMGAIKLLVEHATVRTISNGDVFTHSDAQNHAQTLGIDGVMSARGLLQNPALFAGYESCPWEAVEFFMNKVVQEPIPFKLVVHHLSEMCGTDHSQRRAGGGALFDKETRRGLMECGNMVELIDWLGSIRELKRLR